MTTKSTPNRLALLLGTAVALTASPAAAWDFSLWGQDLALDATNTFKYTYHLDNDGLFTDTDNEDDSFHQFLNTLDVNLSAGEFRLGARLDVNGFAGHYTGFPDRYNNNVALERIFLTWARPEFDMTLGDFYASFGKGIALHAVKVDELGLDLAIRGGSMVIHQGPIEWTMLGGIFNFLEVDQATGWSARWAQDPVVASRLEVQAVDWLNVSGHVVFNPLECRLGYCVNGADRWYLGHNLVGGGGVEVPDLLDGLLALSVEFDYKYTTPPEAMALGSGDATHGYAVYGTATLQWRDLTVLGEFKYYDNYELRAQKVTLWDSLSTPEPYPLRYSVPPTLEWIQAEITNNHSVLGPRGRVDYNFSTIEAVELVLFLNYAYFENWNNGSGYSNRTIHNPAGGFDLTWEQGPGQAIFEGGWRHETADDGPVVPGVNSDIYQSDIYLELDMEQGLAEHHGLKLYTLQMIRRNFADSDFDTGELEAWHEMQATIEYKWSPYLTVGFNYERYTRKPRIYDDEGRAIAGDKEHYFAGYARYFITTGTYVDMRVGENRPGIKCFNGTCRFWPAFSGVRLTLVGRFNDLDELLP